MRIAIVSRAENVSGKEIMTLELGTGLRDAGHELRYFSSLWNDGDYGKRLKKLGLDVTCGHLGAISATVKRKPLAQTLQQLVHMPSLWAEYKHLVRNWCPEQVIHTSWHHLLLLWPYLDTRRDWYWVHEVLPDLPHYAAVFTRMATHLKGFIPVSQAVADSLVKLGVPKEKVTVIHNGLGDLPRRVMSDEPERDVRLGIVGQIAPWKGHHDLLAAFAKLCQDGRNCSLHIYGSGVPCYESRLLQQAEELGVQNRIMWHGFVEDRPKIYADLDICVVPVPTGANEALPTVAIEAGLSGLPVVGCRRGGLPEIVKDGVTGTLVECGDVTALSAALDDLVATPDKRAAFGRAALEDTRSRFSKDRFVADFENLMTARNPLNQHS